MSKFQNLYQQKVAELSTTAEPVKQDLLLTFGKLFGGAIIIFTFLSGVIFTVIPLLRNISVHFHTHIMEPIQRWMEAEPTTGNSLMFLLYATTSVVVLYLMRNKIQILFLFLLAQFEKSVLEAKHKTEVRKAAKELKKPFGSKDPQRFNTSLGIPLDKPLSIEPAQNDHPQF